MTEHENIFKKLASRARAGDRAAELELHDRLDRNMLFVVRRILGLGGVASARDRAVHDEACQMGLDNPKLSPTKREQLIASLARRLRDRLMPRRDADWTCPSTIRIDADSSVSIGV